ncbi:hypothetical protein Dred_1752 [Desulforamulus reducens MI-1]|uniref:N-acetyltransferase domain-containing protein n=1 Tax=Desulforamulus reducens (strain ATCC BAA-1160 / DSM 100696 / MI-1) TaxID=349161 RepID=A4J5C4_DESRM|nr:hypothetical protein [Desulforamulus reducens]ABO50277.1 hypothetical protein Dred_1752 [Desulforamulus reducens MI-1]
MHIMTTLDKDLESFQATLEGLVEQPLCFIKHVLFPNCIYLTSNEEQNVKSEEERFYLIFEIKNDHKGFRQAKIHFFQLPQQMRNKHLGTKVYLLLENYLKLQSCLSIELEAMVNSLNPGDNSVGFWSRQGFLPSAFYAFNDENFPMVKRFN